MQKLPALTCRQVLKLLLAEGWERKRNTRHAVLLQKRFPDGTKIAFVKDSRAIIPPPVLSDILGPKQTGIGRDGLRRLIERYGLP